MDPANLRERIRQRLPAVGFREHGRNTEFVRIIRVHSL